MSTPTAAPARLALLRECSLQFGAERVALSRKDAALLAVLALDGSCARDALAAMLWPAQDLARARASLRQRRFRLARAVGRPLTEGDDALHLSGDVRHDLHDPDAALLSDAALVQGDLLEGLEYGDCPDFERWLQLARERWRVTRAQALARVASQLEDDGQLARALQCAEWLAVEEPLSDHAHRRLMRLHHLRGDLGAALAVYRRLHERLAQELGELPDDETAALAASLRSGEAPPRTSAPLPANLLRAPLRVGRASAWRSMQQAWGAHASLVVEGSAGIGKTRLLMDFVMQRHAGTALHTGALPSDNEHPYALLTRLLGRLWLDGDALQAQGHRTVPAWALREMAALLPELGDAPPRLDALRLQRALAVAFAHSGLELVVLDDVQQADTATLELLPGLVGAHLPRWWLGVRTDESPTPLRDWLQASVAPHHVLLQPLDAPAIAELLDALALPALGGAAWADALLRHTGGLPLFLVETLRSLHGHAMPRPADLAALPPSGGVERVVRTRLSRLPEQALQLARAAAVVETPLQLADCTELLGGAALGWSAAFDALHATRWLDSRGAMHDLVRAVVRQEMSTAQRQWLHARVAQWRSDNGAPAAEVARHWEAAARDELAAAAFEAAARAARRMARPQDEAALWDRAIAAWQRCDQRPRRFAAWRESIEARIFVAGPAAVLPLTERLLDDAVGDAERLDALIAHGEVGLLLGRIDAVLDWAGKALAIARRLGDPGGQLLAARCLATAQAQAAQSDRAMAVLAQVRSLADAGGVRQQQGYLSTLSMVLHRASRLTECADALRRTIALAETDEDWVEACTNASNMASLLCSLGRFDAARRAADQALRLRERIGPVGGVHAANVDVTHGLALQGLGLLGGALSAFQRARDAFAASGSDGPWCTLADNALATAHLLRGDVNAAAARLGNLAAHVPAFVAARHHLLRARIARRRRLDPAPALRQALDQVGAAGEAAPRLTVHAEMALSLAPAQRAERLLELSAQARAVEQFAVAARLDCGRVQALGAAGQRAAAVQAARQVLADTARPSDLLPAQRLFIAHRALAEGGERRAAAVLLGRARRALHDTLADLAPLPGPSLQGFDEPPR